MMEAASTSETSVNFYQITQRKKQEDSNLHIYIAWCIYAFSFHFRVSQVLFIGDNSPLFLLGTVTFSDEDRLVFSLGFVLDRFTRNVTGHCTVCLDIKTSYEIKTCSVRRLLK
jgi:hypothetical protein